MRKVLLGVNIDHVATIREARKGNEPDPVYAAMLVEQAGADQVTIHLREDRRHINDRDLRLIRQVVKTKLNLEMALEDEIISIAKEVKPDCVTLVPEKREEVTTEGGLDVVVHFDKIKKVVEEFEKLGIEVSLFIDADEKQIKASYKAGAKYIEIHTGQFANALNEEEYQSELNRIKEMAEEAHNLGIEVRAGHGLNYQNVTDIANIEEIVELNIGHSIISRAVFSGLWEAVSAMKRLINE